jgi:glycerol-3-phosphate dehydrogenase
VTGDRPYDVAVIGAGVVGTAIARQLARYRLRTVVLERANDVGSGTSKANTAILHTGFDTEPDTLESRLVHRGHDLLAEYAARSGIALEPTGALLVAWDEAQGGRLDGVVAKAHANGYLPAHRIAADELYRREPGLGPGATGAVVVPDEWIICPWSPSIAFATEAVGAGVELRLGTEVRGVSGGADGWALATSGGPVRADWVVNAAGLDADLLDRRFGGGNFTVTPRRGQLIVFDKLARPLLSSILLPVPTERTKGVLVAPTVYGNVILGPTAEDLTDRTDTATTGTGLDGLLEAGRHLLPGLIDEEVTATYAGLRAATEHRDYQISVDADRRYACVGGIRSTGLTASLAIAEYVVGEMAAAGLALRDAAHEPSIPRMPPLGEGGQRPYQDDERIASDPRGGRIVCFCERVTEGEVSAALTSPIPAVDLGGLRRRTRATNGRCQGFFCGAAIAARLVDGGS